MALRATLSKPSVAPATKASGLRVAVQRVATTAGVSVASLALALAAHADVSSGGEQDGGGREADSTSSREAIARRTFAPLSLLLSP